MSEKLAFRSLAIFGSATFTIVMSSSSMNVPMHTTISVHHLRSISPTDLKPLAGSPDRCARAHGSWLIPLPAAGETDKFVRGDCPRYDSVAAQWKRRGVRIPGGVRT